MRRSAEPILAALVVALACAALAPAGAGAEPIALESRRVAFSEEEGVAGIGRLAFRGGIHITSPDVRFGGWSGLSVTDGGASLVAISDHGYWMTARLLYASDGMLDGLGDGEIGELIDPIGQRLSGRRRRDSEEVAVLPDGFAVAFEGDHRIWRYPFGRRPFAAPPLVLDPPPGLVRAPSNRGVEAMAALSGGRLFALTEGLEAAPGEMRGWIDLDGSRRAWRPLSWVLRGEFVPSGAAALPSGDVLVLERRFNWIGGLASRISLVREAAIRPAARLQGDEIAVLQTPLVHENFEGIAAVRAADGGTVVYLVSDDNYDPVLQRTLLLMFELRP